MIAYGIFDGVARRGHLAAVAVFRPEDYQQIHGGGIGDYLDYLLRLEDALNGIQDPLRVVRVPFDPEMYHAWLERSPWEDGPEARSAWALAVAESEAQLAEVRKRHPVLPAAPEDERRTAEVLFLAVPVVCAGEEDLYRLARQFEPRAVMALWDRFRGRMPRTTGYYQISPLRARGADLLVGDRLVGPDLAEELAEYLQAAAWNEGPQGVASVPRRFRFRRTDLMEFARSLPVLVPTFLAVVLRGAQGDVSFLADWLMACQQEFLAEVGLRVVDLLASAGWREDKVGRPGPLLEAWEIADFLELAAAEFGRDDGGEDGEDTGPPGTDPGAARLGSGRRRLRRVK